MRSDFRARRGLRALVIVIAVSSMLGGALAGVAGATPPTNLQRAQRGAQWLANQIKHNGGFVKSFGVADPSDTAYAVIGMRAAGVDKPASDLAIRYLRTKIGSEVQLNGHDSAGALGYYILAAVADNQDPRRFGGTNPQNNLVARLLATARTTGTDKGLFGVQDPTYDGAFRQGLALAALRAAHVPGDNARRRGRGLVDDEAAVRQRLVAGVPLQHGDRVRAGGPEQFHRTRYEQHLVGRAGSRRLGRAPEAIARPAIARRGSICERRLAVHCRAESGRGPELHRARDPGAARRRQLAHRDHVDEGNEDAVYRARELPAQLLTAGLRRVLLPRQHVTKRLRDRPGGPGDGRQDAAGRRFDGVDDRFAHAMLIERNG